MKVPIAMIVGGWLMILLASNLAASCADRYDNIGTHCGFMAVPVLAAGIALIGIGFAQIEKHIDN